MAQIADLTIKIQAQIAEFVSEFKEATKVTQQFQKDFEGTATKAVAVGSIYRDVFNFIVNSASSMGKAVLENASNVTDLANKTGLATQTIQQFQFVADQTGTTVDAFADAAFRLGAKLAGGGTSVVKAVEDLGLSFKSIQALSPDEKFNQIAEALGRIEDPGERARLGLILFDRTFKNIAPAIAEGYKKMADGAETSTRAQLDAIDALDDAWRRFQANTLTRATNIAGGLVLAAEEIQRSSFFEIMKVMAAASLTGSPFQAVEGFAARGIARAGLSKQLKDVELENIIPTNFVKELDEARKKIASLSLETRKQISAAKDLGATTAELTDRFGLSSAELKIFDQLTKQSTGSLRSGKVAVDEYAAVMQKIRDAQIPLTESQKTQINQLDALNISHHDIAIAVKASVIAVGNYVKAGEDLNRMAREQIPLLKATFDEFQNFTGLGDIDLSNVPNLARSFDEVRASFDKPLVPLVDVSVALQQIDAVVTEWDKRVARFKNNLRNIGLDGAHTFAEGIAEGIRTGDWGAAGQAFEDAMAGMMSDGMAAAVDFFVPGLGRALQPIFDAISEKITGAFDFNEGRDLVQDFAASFGGFDALHDKLLEMGAAGEALWKKLTQGVGRDNPAQAKAVIEEITQALDDFGTESERAANRVSAIGGAIDAINAKATAFASPFENLLKGTENIDEVKAKLAAMGQVGQAEFERIGTFAAAAFAGLVKETGNALGAIQQLGPTFQVLQDGVTKFGLTSTGTIDALISMFALVNDAVTGPILQAIQTTGQIFAGLQEGGILTADLFQTVATDIGASFRELEAKGGDVAKAMALSQPVLQRLWEAQQIYGDITDETTRSLLEQAEQQGLVGAHMRDVNQKILDVLIAIADVFGAKIPEGMRQTQRAATETARTVEDEFSRIKIPKITVGVGFDFDDWTDFFENQPPPDRVPHMASGGIVRRPTLALIGESGPEAVVPLSQLGGVSRTDTSTVIFEIDGRQIAAATVPYLPGEVRRYIPA